MNPRNGVDAHIVAAVYIDSGAFDGELPPGTSKATRRAVDAVLQSSGSERLASLRGAVKPAELEEILRLVGNPRPIHGTSGKSNGHRLSFVKASDVEPEQVEWLWKGRIARGKITILEGDPGTGKTTLALSLAACISNGDPLPGEQDGGRPRTVIVFSGEDDIGDTLRPRLDAAGADCSRVIFENLRDPDAVPFMLPRDLDELERTIIEHDAALVIIDPVLSYLDPDTDSHKDQSVRAALMPLAALAQRTRVSIILIRHLNKDSSKSAIHRGGGSIAFTGVARLVLLVAEDPDDPDTCVLARSKGNLGPRPPSLCYSIAAGPGDSGMVLWGGISEHTSTTLLAPEKPGPKPDAIEQAKGYLTDLLANGPRTRQEVVEAGARVHLNEKTIQRAANAIGIVSKAHGKERLWSLS